MLGQHGVKEVVQPERLTSELTTPTKAKYPGVRVFVGVDHAHVLRYTAVVRR